MAICLLRLSSLSKSVPHFPQQTLGATFGEIDFVGAPVGLGKIGANVGAGEYTRLGFSSDLQICLFRLSSLSKVEQHLPQYGANLGKTFGVVDFAGATEGVGKIGAGEDTRGLGFSTNCT